MEFPVRVRPVGLFLVACLVLTGCDAPEKPDSSDRQSAQTSSREEQSDDGAGTPELDPRWQAHLANTPSGPVSARGRLAIDFNHPVVAEQQLGESLSGVVRMEPERPVEAVFTARDRLEVRSKEDWPRGQTLTLVLFAQGLDRVDDSLPPARFRVPVMRQQLSIRVGTLLPVESSHEMVLTGEVRTRDRARDERVQQVLEARQGEDGLEVEWTHGDAGRAHEFTVRGIERSDRASELTLKWDGTSLGVDSQGRKAVTVPARSEFAVTTVRAVDHPQPHVEIAFSEALQRDQNRRGLITINGDPVRPELDGSLLRIYPEGDDVEEARLKIEPGLRSAKGATLSDPLEKKLRLRAEKPGVRFVGRGAILPESDVMSVPFEAAGVRSIKVQAFRVFPNNMGVFLQNHAINDDDRDRSTGRYLWQKTLTLPDEGNGWNRYQLDLTELMERHPDGLVNLKLTIDGQGIAYSCPGGAPEREVTLPEDYEGPGQEREESSIFEQYYEDSGHLSWHKKNDPCSESYYHYNDRASSSRSFLASNIGLLAKKGQDNRLVVVATQIDSNEPAANVELRVFNYQRQVLARGTTNKKGMATLTLEKTPFYLEARQDDDRAFLKLARNQALSTNQFNTGGVEVRDGLKGFFYAERDVWRPGDDIHMTFVLEDREDVIPDDHPLTLDWFDPRGNKVKTYTSDSPVNGFYSFTLSTAEDAPTGNWRAVARLGERYFDTPVRVETIKPNRLKIDLDLPERIQANRSVPVGLKARWLNGATAADLRADVEVRLRTRETRFGGYDAYQFDDPTRELDSEAFTAFEARTDEKGRAQFPLNVEVSQAPGLLDAVLTTRVFEDSGNYSTQVRTAPVYPYEHWVGLRVPEGQGWGGALARDQDHAVDLMSVDSEGEPIENRSLELSVYRIDWRWWWDKGEDDLADFVSDPDTTRVMRKELETGKGGTVQWTLHGSQFDWGRHLIRVCDQSSNHCAAETAYLGWSRDQTAGGQDAATRLALSPDEDQYEVGETAHIQLPAMNKGRLLVSVENGSRVLDHYWKKVSGGKQALDIPITASMAPNVYIHVTYLQPHGNAGNDRPIRLYGVTPVPVNDPDTRLHPQVKAPDKVEPEASFEVRVRERDGKAMTYTLSVVDQGLLGLTNFQTPDPHQYFYKREALGVRTWDLFDKVVGAYGGELDQLLALGGSDQSREGQGKKPRRFPPVVRHYGPFELQKGDARRHEVDLPAYMGEVRAMVVAGQDGAYGKTQDSIRVTQPLTLLPTLPRVLGPGESVYLPVTVFVTEDELDTVALSVDADEAFFELPESKTKLQFDGPGDQIAMLRLRAKDRVGTGRVTVTANSGDHKTSRTVHLPVRVANSPTTRDWHKRLEPGESWTRKHRPHGLEGTNEATLTVSSIPAMGLERRLESLLQYPHGCIEQTTSAAFPQLYLDQLMQLTPSRKKEIQKNIAAAIKRLQGFQLADGGFSYWPGGGHASDWATSYAGHFLVEARRLGYAVPGDVLENWRQFQRRRSDSIEQHPWSWMAEAYRLYTLALSGKPHVSGMNRLRERLQSAGEHYSDNASYIHAHWLLGAAYQQMGVQDVARELIGRRPKGEAHYNNAGYTYGSSLRDRAIRLLVLQQRQDDPEAWNEAKIIAEQLSEKDWLSTQSTAWALMAMARYAGARDGDQSYDVAIREGNQDWQELHVSSPVYQQELEVVSGRERVLAVRNDSDRRLFATLSNTGTPPAGEERAVNRGLSLDVSFHDEQGPVNPAQLEQGRDFTARVEVTNTGLEKVDNIALTQVLPSGWQITDSRLDGSAERQGEGDIDYQDLRDDRVLSYFDLEPGASNAVTLELGLNASFAGRFYLPGWKAEAMYDGDKRARTEGQWVRVVR